MLAQMQIVILTALVVAVTSAPQRLRTQPSPDTGLLQSASGSNSTQGIQAGQVEVVTTVVVNGVQQPPDGTGGDVVTFETWTLLKAAMEKIRNQVKEVMAVGSNMEMLQKDLQTQEGLWHTAEQQLQANNDALEAEAAQLREQIKQGEALRAEVQNLKLQIQHAKEQSDKAWREAHHENERMEFQRRFYYQRRDNLSHVLYGINATIRDEVAKAHERQLQLETDGVALRVKAGELQDRVKNGAKEMMIAEDQASAKTLELQRQIAGMQDGMSRMQNDLKGGGAVAVQEAELAKTKGQLDHEISSMLNVKQEQDQVVAHCEQMREARHGALMAEQAKAQRREQEMNQLCMPVRGQLLELKDMLAHCEALSQPTAPMLAPVTPAIR